jgi:hypothetical protein
VKQADDNEAPYNCTSATTLAIELAKNVVMYVVAWSTSARRHWNRDQLIRRSGLGLDSKEQLTHI